MLEADASLALLLPVGVSSASSSIASLCPKRELFREYGRAGPGVRGFAMAVLPGPGLAANRGVPIWLLFSPAGAAGAFPGVAAKFGAFLRGDSGRGRDGRDFALNVGLGARAPGPTDCENLRADGVGGL